MLGAARASLSVGTLPLYTGMYTEQGPGVHGWELYFQAGLPGIIKEFFTVSSVIVTNRPSALSFDILCLILRETLDVSRHDPNVVGNRKFHGRSPNDETVPTVQAITPCWEPRTPTKQEQSSPNVV